MQRKGFYFLVVFSFQHSRKKKKNKQVSLIKGALLIAKSVLNTSESATVVAQVPWMDTHPPCARWLPELPRTLVANMMLSKRARKSLEPRWSPSQPTQPGRWLWGVRCQSGV